MYLIQPQLQSRRAFMRRAGQLAFTGAALPTAINLAALGEAAAFNATDYKALVCVFLYGGNDYANTLIPYDATSYASYQTIRGTTGSELANGIALAKAALAPTLLQATPQSAIGTAGLQYAMHPSMTGMHDLFGTGKLAAVLNTGPLMKPITKTQYTSNDRRNYPLPPKLFSHNDQQSIWQSSSPEGSTVGWGGNLGDLAMSGNGTNSLFTCISVTGNAVFLSGDQALSYQIGTGGAVRINSVGTPYGIPEVGVSMKKIATAARTHQLENEYNSITKRAVDAEALISSAIAASAPPQGGYAAGSPYAAFAQDNPLAVQLRMVARLIAAQATLGVKRQVFLVSLGGFDLHDNLLDGHTRNMGRVSSAMKAFYDATVALNVSNKVTTFTASDFGRTLTSNGDGSDHGWGGHQFVMGDAVKGNAYYGYAPPVSVGSTTAAADQWHVGQGRLLPTTSVDQYAATLAKWFGVESGEMTGILPNLSSFNGAQLTVNGTTLTYANDLGFMSTT